MPLSAPVLLELATTTALLVFRFRFLADAEEATYCCKLCWSWDGLPAVTLPLLFFAVLSTPSKSWPERCWLLVGNWWCEEPVFEVVPITELFLLPGARFGVEGWDVLTPSVWWLWWCSLFSRRLSTSFLSYSRSFSSACFYFRSYLLTRKSILFLSISAAFSYRLFSVVFDFSSLTMCNWSDRLRIVYCALINLSWDSFSVLYYRRRLI